jgi:hypothetical protein
MEINFVHLMKRIEALGHPWVEVEELTTNPWDDKQVKHLVSVEES